MMQPFWYDGQIRAYLLQFVAIFQGLQVQTGIGSCGTSELITVPCVIGNKDRVVAALHTGNTHNRVFSLPTMAVHMSGLQPDPERRKVQGFVYERTTMRQGGIFPDDLTVVKRVPPIPYKMTLELSIYASNMMERDQILEQLLVLFNPDLQIQKSDAAFDWTKITRVELTDIGNEENYPSSTDKRMIIWSLTFEMPIFLSMPMGVKDDLVRRVIIQIGELDKMNVDEVDENGELTPYGAPLAQIEIDARTPVDGAPDEPAAQV